MQVVPFNPQGSKLNAEFKVNETTYHVYMLPDCNGSPLPLQTLQLEVHGMLTYMCMYVYILAYIT